MDKMNGKSADILSENIEKLKEIFPDAFTEGKVDFDALRQILGDYTDERPERYSFTWNGKSKARRIAQTPSTGTLRPCPEESVNWDTTRNLFIEGDNLEVLKLLQKSYHKKVKMIYIDPPYNTGKDFIYPDNYRDNIKNYLELTGQTDEEGRKMSANAETSGRYHTDWLNMMYPRLKLARNLLRDDGVIFISIDDNEVANIRKVCDEIFGEENFISSLAVQLNPRGRHLDKFVAQTHETVIIYCKNINNDSTMIGVEKIGRMLEEYNKEDSNGKYRLLGLRNRNQAFNPITRPKLYYPLYVNPKTKEISLSMTKEYTDEVLPITTDGIKTCWTWGKQKVEKDLHLLTAEKVSDEWRIFRKDYLYNDDGKTATTLVKSLWIDKEINNDYGRKVIKELFGSSIMDFPKAPELIRKLLSTGVDDNSIVLDFFAGSSTTAHAVLDLNIKDDMDVKFIMVQLPEPCDENTEAFKAGYKTIADIGKERIRRAGKKILEGLTTKGTKEHEKESKKDKSVLFDDTEELPDNNLHTSAKSADSIDIGFKVFKLDSSNVIPWDATAENLEDVLPLTVDNIKDDRKEADVLFEILLKYGLDLTVPIEERTIAGKTVYSIGMGALIVCLAKKITIDVVEGIAELKKELNPEVVRVVFRDSGFPDDVVKTNAVQILRQAGIDDVKSL